MYTYMSSLNVVKEIALNPNTPVGVLAKLADHEKSMVRACVAENPKTSKEILLKLSKSGDTEVCEGVAKNPSTPPELLEQMVLKYYDKKKSEQECELRKKQEKEYIERQKKHK